jgi:cation:H+ antiporter
MQFFTLLVGVAGLWLGTQLTIRGAVAVAERLAVPEFVIGILVLSVGSDLPELAIAVDAAIKNLQGGQASDVVVGSAIGSSLGQFGFALGVAGLFGVLTLRRRATYQHGSVLLGSVLLLAVFALDGMISRPEGLALVCAYALYLVFVLSRVASLTKPPEEKAQSSLGVFVVYMLVGLAILTVSAELTVASAVNVAEILGVEQALVAILVLGLGSSVPELAISIGAVMKGRTMLSVGNLIGSNVFDTLVPIGVAAAIAPLRFNGDILRLELPVLFGLTALVLLFFLWTGEIRVRQASIILVAYIGYVVMKLVGA